MIGSKLQNRYELRAELGRGGMGIVYRAYDPVLGRDVAIKMIPPMLLNPESEQRFEREARLVAGMDHPGIVSIHDFGHHEGSLFFVMPFVRGTLLQEQNAKDDLTLEEILEITLQVAEALDYSHVRGVVHRDIKPGNIIVSREGRGIRARVLDFGLARGSSSRRLTRTGNLLGTFAHLAPEQISDGKAEPASDLYALGTVLYESLTGEPPFAGAIHTVLYRIVHEPPKSLRDHGLALDPELEHLTLQCLAKSPADRPASCGELAAGLAAVRDRLDGAARRRRRGPVKPARRTFPTVAAPLVGRTAEWSELQRHFRSAVDGVCHLVLLEGEPGTGKTRLLAELENLAAAEEVRVLHGRFVDQESAIPYQGLCELIQDYFRQGEASSPAATDASGSTDLRDLAPELARYFPILHELASPAAGTSGETAKPTPPSAAARPGSKPAVGAHGDRADRAHLDELLARALARIGDSRPIVLALENLHEADVSLRTLGYIARRLGPTPTLLVGTCRPTDLEPRHGLHRLVKGFHDDPRFVVISLKPLERDAFRRLLELHLGDARLGDDVLERLFEATEGNPYFGQELVRWLLETDGLRRDESGSWSLVADPTFVSEALPVTLHQAIEGRLERLTAPSRRLLSRISILGRTFHAGEIPLLAALDENAAADKAAPDAAAPDAAAPDAAAPDDSTEALGEAVDRLIDLGFLVEELQSRDDRLSFASGVMREVLYFDLPRRRRRVFHRRYAEALEKQPPRGLRGHLEPLLLHHFAAGDAAAKTTEYALRLAKKSLAACAPEDALRVLKTASGLLDDETTSPVAELHELAANALQSIGATERALTEAERAAGLFETLGETVRAARVALLAAETAWRTRRVDDARPWIERGLELIAQSRTAPSAGREGDETARRLLTLAATVANLRGEHDEARRHLEQAERLAPRAPEGEDDAPVMGGTLKTVLPHPVSTIDPAALRTFEESEVSSNIFETLLTVDGNGHLIPGLATEWRFLDGYRVCEIVLRDNVRFSDGRPLGGADVAASFKRALRRQKGFGGAAFTVLRALEVVEVDEKDERNAGGQTLRFHLDEPLPIFPTLLTDPATAVVREIYSEGGAELVGTGPFRLAELSAERVVLERNPNEWKGTPALVDRILFSTSLDASGIAAGLRAGELDVGRDLQPEALEEIEREPRFVKRLVEIPKANVYFLLLRPGGALREPSLRQKLLGAVRVEDLVWRSLGRFARPAAGLLPPGILGHDPTRRPAAPADEPHPVPPALDPPPPLRAAVHPVFGQRYRALWTALLDFWNDLGITVDNVTPTLDDYLAAWEGQRDVDLVLGRWNAHYPDPDAFSYALFHSRTGQLRHLLETSHVDGILERARRETDAGERVMLYRRFERRLVEESVLLPLFHEVDYRIAGPEVERLRSLVKVPHVDYARLGKRRRDGGAVAKLADGGEIRIALTRRLGSLDPADGNLAETYEVKANIFETLTRIGEGARVVPWLAAFFEIPGGRAYHFRLRDRLRFHDGRPLTSRDVRFTFERLLKNRHSDLSFLLLPIRGARDLHRGEAAGLAGLTIVSERELVLELEEPLPFFPALLSHPGLGIVPEGLETIEGSWRDSAIGTGPFRVLRFEPDVEAILERHPQYWRPESPRCQRLRFHFGVTPRQAFEGFTAGRLDLVGQLYPDDVLTLRRDAELAAGYQEAPLLSTTFLALNRHREPFRDPAKRCILAEILGADNSLHATAGPTALLARGFIPPGLLGHEGTETADAKNTDASRIDSLAAASGSVTTPDRPRETLAELSATVALQSSFTHQFAPFWKRLHDLLTDAGLGLDVADRPLRELIRQGSLPEIDMAAMRWVADYPDADAFVVGLLDSQEGILAGFASSPQIDALILRGRRESDPRLRHAIYREIEKILVGEHLLIPLFHEQSYRFVRPEINGLKLGLAMPEVRYDELLRRS